MFELVSLSIAVVCPFLEGWQVCPWKGFNEWSIPLIMWQADKEKETNGKNDKGQNAIHISDFLHLKHFHINSCEEPPNNSLSLYRTVTHCATIARSPHISWLISLLTQALWPQLTFSQTPLAPSSTQRGHCSDEGSSKVDCVSFSAPNKSWPLVAVTQSPPHRNVPLDIPGKVIGGDLASAGRSGPRVITTLALSLVPFIQRQKCCSGGRGFVLVRVHSVYWRIVPLPSKVFCWVFQCYFSVCLPDLLHFCIRRESCVLLAHLLHFFSDTESWFCRFSTIYVFQDSLLYCYSKTVLTYSV